MATKSIKSNNPLDQFPHLPDEAGVRVPVVCAVLGCSPSTVWRMAKKGKLQTRKISDSVRVFIVGSVRAALSGGC
jgi:hypothetical protein